jgi:hypothetical protein
VARLAVPEVQDLMVSQFHWLAAAAVVAGASVLVVPVGVESQREMIF